MANSSESPHGSSEELRTAAVLQNAANSPETHAAAIRAATDLLREHADWHSSDIPSAAQMHTVAMHAAILMRAYLRFIADQDTDHIGVEQPE
jgi:hypothetical protein